MALVEPERVIRGYLAFCGKHLPPGMLPSERRTYKVGLIPLTEEAESKSHKGSSGLRARELFSPFSLSSLPPHFLYELNEVLS